MEQMIASGRKALLLRPQIAASLSAGELAAAQVALDETMAIVPQGPVAVRARCYDSLDEAHAPGERLVQVEGFFLDRYPVTNREYQLFVDDGGYEQMSLWDESIWPAVLGFVDRPGSPARDTGKTASFPPAKKTIRSSASAGTKLRPSPAGSASACRPIPNGSRPALGRSSAEGGKPVQRKFPWGDAMDRRLRQPLGQRRQRHRSPSQPRPAASSVGGVQQLVGNVWEWTSIDVRRVGTGRPQDRNGHCRSRAFAAARSTPTSTPRPTASSKAAKARWPANTTSASAVPSASATSFITRGSVRCRRNSPNGPTRRTRRGARMRAHRHPRTRFVSPGGLHGPLPVLHLRRRQQLRRGAVPPLPRPDGPGPSGQHRRRSIRG